MQWWETAAGSLVGSGLLLAALKALWAKLEAKDKEIAALNAKLELLADRRISDLREMLRLNDSEHD